LAVERGCGWVEWCVLDWNEPAIGFRRASGWWDDGVGGEPVAGEEFREVRLTYTPPLRLAPEGE